MLENKFQEFADYFARCAHNGSMYSQKCPSLRPGPRPERDPGTTFAAFATGYGLSNSATRAESWELKAKSCLSPLPPLYPGGVSKRPIFQNKSFKINNGPSKNVRNRGDFRRQTSSNRPFLYSILGFVLLSRRQALEEPIPQQISQGHECLGHVELQAFFHLRYLKSADLWPSAVIR